MADGGFRILEVRDFSGGLNLRDSPDKVAPNETPDCMNITLDERGAVRKRLGLERFGNPMAGVAKNGFWSEALQRFIVQVGQNLYKTTDFLTWTQFGTASPTFTTSARCAMCDFAGKLVYVHPVDGVFDYDNASATLRNATVKGTCITAWQNKVWAAGVGTTVWWSNAGTSATWTTGTDFNNIRDKDDQPVTAIGIGHGMDVVGRPGLLVFKEDSSYRINSASLGSYTTIDGENGAIGPLAVCSIGNRTAVVNKRGVWVTDGVGQLEKVSGKIDPIFTAEGLDTPGMDAQIACAGVFKGKMLFSLPRAGSATVNNMTLEYHPDEGWFVPHSFGVNWFQNYPTTQELIGGCPSASYLDKVFKGGSDEGASISCRFRTAWISPNRSGKCRIRTLRINHTGDPIAHFFRDFEKGQGETITLTSPDPAPTYDDPAALYDSGLLWDATEDSSEVYTSVYSLGIARHCAFSIEETSNDTLLGLPILGDGVAPSIGAAALYGFRIDFVPLGLA